MTLLNRVSAWFLIFDSNFSQNHNKSKRNDFFSHGCKKSLVSLNYFLTAAVVKILQLFPASLWQKYTFFFLQPLCNLFISIKWAGLMWKWAGLMWRTVRRGSETVLSRTNFEERKNCFTGTFLVQDSHRRKQIPPSPVVFFFLFPDSTRS